uniref:Uncharacterized protein n=1 Tax=Anguilla anguilla TaxID=7936 RepID=A0A0E9T3H6_ANGAN
MMMMVRMLMLLLARF